MFLGQALGAYKPSACALAPLFGEVTLAQLLSDSGRWRIDGPFRSRAHRCGRRRLFRHIAEICMVSPFFGQGSAMAVRISPACRRPPVRPEDRLDPFVI